MKMRPNGDDYEVVDVLQEGEHFGETAIILGHPRSSTVIAVEFSELYSLARADLLEVYQQWPDLYRQFQDFGETLGSQGTPPLPTSLLLLPSCLLPFQSFCCVSLFLLTPFPHSLSYLPER